MDRILKGASVLFLAVLVWLSLYLGAHRIFQVDECTEVYTARLLATGRAQLHPGGIALLQFPLSWLAKNASHSAAILTSARFFMVVVFWCNIVLLALGTGESLKTGRGLVALLGAATLAPLWDYGFEIRHDNLLLTGLLLTWYLVRVRPAGWSSYLGVGMLAVAMQFAAHKAFAYVAPLTLAILSFPPPGHKLSRWKAVSFWLVGALVAFVFLRWMYAFDGAGDLAGSSKSGVEFVSKVSVSDSRFWPTWTLARLFWQTPLLLALVSAAMFTVYLEVFRKGRQAMNWRGCVPEAALFLTALGILFVNPTPFPYNLLHLVPFAFLLAYRYGARLWTQIVSSPKVVLFFGVILTITHLVAFGVATSRHLDWTNSRQIELIQLAESVTDSEHDPVFDGVGLVSTRPVINPASFLHSLSVRTLLEPGATTIADMLAARPAAVIMLNYRTDWLRKEDHEYIREHYVPLAQDFWVLGKLLPPGGGTFNVIHPGRYQIAANLGSSVLDTRKRDHEFQRSLSLGTNCVGMLDGMPITSLPVKLAIGAHTIEVNSNCEPAVVWLGPKRNRWEPLSEGDPRNLFVNWY